VSQRAFRPRAFAPYAEQRSDVRRGLQTGSSFRVPPARPSLCRDRQPLGPCRYFGYEMVKCFEVDGAFRYFGDELVVHMQDDRETGGLDPQHRLRENVARDRLYDVFCDLAAIQTFVAPLPGRIILVDNAKTVSFTIFD